MSPPNLEGLAVEVRQLIDTVKALEKKIETLQSDRELRSRELAALRSDVTNVQKDVDTLLRHLVNGHNGSLPILTKLVMQTKTIEDLAGRIARQEVRADTDFREGKAARAQLLITVLSGIFSLTAAAIALLK